MKPILSKPQLNYTKAKTKFEDRAKVLEKKIEETQKLQEITEQVMEGLVLETGFHEAYVALTEAENELIEWSRVTMKHEKEYKDNKGAIDNFYSNVNANPELRAQLINLAMKVR
ncbi:hypothetical protein [Paenibacillus physcomitrellae]|uniref:Uncharacterized protein n=1 Tax=Paenibacillus physcomitrellae TaxID=1619311 RepID=A0ABQ1GIH2_9BACL|nr:hypothetical protein [Paenibacillus physcomitrellae]GGA43896.1 hypothetical protein GCM10010917_31500 [Paenibacillus physcomitrellae]